MQKLQVESDRVKFRNFIAVFHCIFLLLDFLLLENTAIWLIYCHIAFMVVALQLAEKAIQLSDGLRL